MTTLRPYQQAAVDSVFRYWAKGGPGSPLIECPTGSGKSLIVAAITQRLVQEFDTRVIVATHRKELIEQDARAIRSLWPAAPVGVFSAGLNSKRIDVITVGGIQSMLPHAKKHGMAAPGVVLIDEAHLLSEDEGGQYRQFLTLLRDQNPDLRLVGLTATPYRMSQGLLTSGSEALFSSIVYRADVLDLVTQGFLSPLVAPGHATQQISTEGIHITAGEFNNRDAEIAADIESVNSAVSKDVAEALRAGRTSALVFGTSVAHAEHLANALELAGVRSQVVTGATLPMERAAALNAFKSRSLPCICSCDVLTTGFDAPVTDVIAMVRPTKSPGLYVQMVGRGMRRADGKSDCLLLDYGGNVARHGPITAVRTPEGRKAEKGEAPVKTCPSCQAELPASCRQCVHCDFEFPAPEIAVDDRASNLDPMAAPAMAEKHEVALVKCRVHVSKNSGKNTLKVDFIDQTYLPVVSEYVCLEHDGFARIKAEKWWASFFMCPPPAQCADAVRLFNEGQMRQVRTIKVVQDGKYKRIKSAEFHPESFSAPIREPGSDDAPPLLESLENAYAVFDGDDIPL